MIDRLWLSLAALGWIAAAGAPAEIDPARIDEGRDVYELARGSVPIAVRIDGSGWRTAEPEQACRACHGDSGEGLSEGTIAAPALAALATEAGDGVDAWLEAALVRGRGRNGHVLSAEMPRYRMGRDDLAALSAYLRALPQVAAPGVQPSELTIRVSTAGAALGDAGRAMLASRLDALGAEVRANGGIFGRNPRFDLDGAAGQAPLIILAWRAETGNSSYPVISLRPAPTEAERIPRLDCGAMDPAAADQMRAVELWAERQGLNAMLANHDAIGDVQGKAVIVTPAVSIAPFALADASSVFAPVDLVARWPANERPEKLRIVAGGDMEKRTRVARALLADGLRDPREAMVIAVYLEAASMIVDTLRASGRRLRRVGFCDNLRAATRAGHLVSIIDGASITVLPATGL